MSVKEIVDKISGDAMEPEGSVCEQQFSADFYFYIISYLLLLLLLLFFCG